jgi:hypothetical protein
MGRYENAKAEAEALLRATAQARGTVTYSALVREIKALPLEPDSKVLAQILDQISIENDAAGRGMLSAVVIHKTEDYLPGPGFFSLASRLGRNASDKVASQAHELERVHNAFPS